MKIALCTTTIHVPHALKLLRKCSPDVMFFIAGDRKSPDLEITEMLEDVPNHMYFGADWSNKWKCSKLIGENTLARRNIAFLEAIKWGADVIYSWDDDNISVDANHFANISKLFDGYGLRHVPGKTEPLREIFPHLFNGISVTGAEGWFDPGQLLIPVTRHRGISYAARKTFRASSVVDIRIGVAAGLVIGDPDIDATTRMEIRPDISAVHVLGSAGVVVQRDNWTVFNSQNTAVIRELMPAWFMMPNVGRHDDIYASLIVQRVARERNLHVHFGQPFTYQQRNEHDLLVDFKAEISGMENTIKLADLLDSILLKGRSVIEDVRTIYQTLCHCAFIPEASARAGLAWLEDCEQVM